MNILIPICCAGVLLMVSIPASSDTSPMMPGVASQVDVAATCTKAVVNGFDDTRACQGFRKTVLGSGTTIVLMKIAGTTITFAGKADPKSTVGHSILALNNVYIGEVPLAADGTCIVDGDTAAKFQLVCDTSAVGHDHSYRFHVEFVSATSASK